MDAIVFTDMNAIQTRHYEATYHQEKIKAQVWNYLASRLGNEHDAILTIMETKYKLNVQNYKATPIQNKK